MKIRQIILAKARMLSAVLPPQWLYSVATLKEQIDRRAADCQELLPRREPNDEERARGALSILVEESKSTYRHWRRVARALVTIAPDYAPAWLVLGYSNARLHSYEKAKGEYRVFCLMKRDVNACKALATICHLSGDPVGEYKALRAAVEITQSDPELWWSLADCESRLGHPKEAVYSYEKLLKIEENRAGAWFELALSALKSSQYLKAYKAFSTAAALLDALKADDGYRFGDYEAYLRQLAYSCDGKEKVANEFARILLKTDPKGVESFFHSFAYCERRPETHTGGPAQDDEAWILSRANALCQGVTG